jgi:hypothetical protein
MASWRDKLGLEPDTHSSQLVTIPTGTPGAPVETTQEANVKTAEVEELCRESLDFLAAIAIPTVFRYFFPPVFKAIWTWLLSFVHRTRDFSQLAIGLPRGFGKTMLIKIFVLYCILFTRKQFILVTCGTLAKAVNIITDIMNMLNEPNIRKIFGDWKLGIQTDRQELKRFGFRGRNIILMGFGVGGDVRGITLENQRPDIMIFDDIQTREDANSETVSNNLEEWMVGTAMKAKSPHGCLFIFIANMYPTKHSLLRKLKANPTWTKFIAGGILADGTSLWEDLQPLTQLLQEYQNDLAMGKPEVFYAEVLNDENASVNNLIDLSSLPEYPFIHSEICLGSFLVIDPSNDKANSDAVTIAHFDMYATDKHPIVPVCRNLVDERLSPGDTIKRALTLCLQHNIRLIAVESNAYQYSLLYWFKTITEQMGIIGIECVDIYSGALAKTSRILSMFKAYRQGEIFVHPECRAAVHAQITGFNPLRRDNVDGILDCLTYAPRVIELHGQYIISLATLEEQEFAAAKVQDELENACF